MTVRLSMATLIALCALGACGKKPATTPTPIRANEVISLRLRDTDRADRPPAREPGSTALRTPASERGEEWQSEKLSATAVAQVRDLLAGNAVEVDANCRVGDLRPDELQKERLRGGFVVRRGLKSEEPGWGELRAALDGLLTEVFEVRVKATGVDVGDDEFSVTLQVELVAEQTQINARWRGRWTRSEPPRLLELMSEQFEEVSGGARSPRRG